MTDFEEQMEFQLVKMNIINKVFNSENIRKRVNTYVDDIYCKTDENRKIRKAFKNQLLSTIKKENDYIKQNIRMMQKKKPLKIRKRREYKPTPYILFCREMREKYQSNELAGKMQELWRERNNKENTIT